MRRQSTPVSIDEPIPYPLIRRIVQRRLKEQAERAAAKARKA